MPPNARSLIEDDCDVLFRSTTLPVGLSPTSPWNGAFRGVLSAERLTCRSFVFGSRGDGLPDDFRILLSNGGRSRRGHGTSGSDGGPSLSNAISRGSIVVYIAT